MNNLGKEFLQMFLNGKNQKDLKDNSSNASKKVDADVHRKEKSEKENTFAYNVCKYVPPKRVNDPETGCLPVDQKMSIPCYSQNGTKVENAEVYKRRNKKKRKKVSF